MTSRWCSTTRIVLPASTRRLSTPRSFLMSSRWSPVVGSSMMYNISLAARAPSSAAILRRCASPPERVVAGWPRRREPRPTSWSTRSRRASPAWAAKNSTASSTVLRGPADRLLVDQADALHVLEAGEGVVDAGRRELGLERARDGAVERVVDERGLAGARHAADDRERVERNPDRHVLEVVLARAHEDEVAPAGAAHGRDRDRLASGDVTRGERARRPLELRLRAGEDDLAAPLARARPELDDVIRGGDELAVVLDHDDGVTRLGEVATELHEAHRVARVQADRRFVEHVERADEL